MTLARPPADGADEPEPFARSDTVKELVLGHVAQGLVAVYDQWLYLDEKREASTPGGTYWPRSFDRGAGAGKVVPLKKK